MKKGVKMIVPNSQACSLLWFKNSLANLLAARPKLVPPARPRDSKTAQVTIFIILGIVIVGVVGGVFYFMNESKKSSEAYFSSAEVNPLIENLYSEIMSCHYAVSEMALDEIAVHGGYYNAPSESYDLESFVPYYYFEGKYLIPSKSKIEKELGKYVDDNFNDCFEVIESEGGSEGFELDYRKPRTKVDIGSGKVEFNSDLRINIEKGGHIINYELEKHPSVVDSKLYEIYEVAEYITNSHKEDSAMYCITCLSDFTEERDLYVDLIPASEVLSVVVITDNSTAVVPYSFVFLNKYTGDEVSPFDDESGEAPEAPEVEG